MATLSKSAKFAMGVQIFLLRRGWMGKMDDFVMIITTTGRKSGKKFTTPIANLALLESVAISKFLCQRSLIA